MDKKVLIIINPRSGTMRANRYMTDIVDLFVHQGYMPTVLTTTKRGDGTEYVEKFAKDYNLIVCIGGDGTFNEVAAGIVNSGAKTPLGYIPSGSTNDFANSLGLSKDILTSAADIIREGSMRNIDLGRFNGRVFSYVASFGAFTATSYNTPQTVKNTLGHLAYILSGVTELANLKKIHMKVDADGEIYEGDYLFGAISNSTSIGGMLSLKEEHVNLNDGYFEMLLIKVPTDIFELNDLISALALQNYYNSKAITFVNAKNFKITTDANLSWTLDGEYQEGSEEIHIENLKSAIETVVIKDGARI